MKPSNKVNHRYEENARRQGHRLIAGVDEAGRGPLAGPVVAAACILPENLQLDGIDDSKKLSPLERYRLYEELINNPNITFGVGIIDSIRIDQINILRATFEAMLIAISKLREAPHHVLIDGNMLPPALTLSAEAIIEGDALSVSIAAASIIAKETRDRIMVEYHASFPNYGFDKHKGYATAEHIAAIIKHGPCPIHRMTFEPLKNMRAAHA